MIWTPYGFRSDGGNHIVNSVRFDGNDYLTDSGWTGAVDGEDGTLSYWFDYKGGDGVRQDIVNTLNGRLLMKRETSNKLVFVLKKSNSTVIWGWTSTDEFDTATNSGWNHLILAWELDASPVGLVFLNDVPLGKSDDTVPTNGSNDWTETVWGVGASSGGSVKTNADLAEFYLDDVFIDISTVQNRRKFITGAGRPVDLGSDGSKPSGAAPLVFLSGATSTWHTNLGSGGGMTENGAISDGASSPSD